MSLTWRRLKRSLTSFRLFLLLLLSILFYHYVIRPVGPSVSRSTLKTAQDRAVLPTDSPKSNIKVIPAKDVPENERSKRVIEAFRHCWKGYKESAFGFDEFHPLSKSGSNWFSLGLTIVDALDTAHLMGQMDIFKEARDWVAGTLKFDWQEGESNVFEITIRVLGGLMTSYHLSGDEVFLQKAVDLGDRLLVAFQTESHIPLSSINFRLKKAIPAPYGGSSTAEATTIQMEFKYLTYLTKDPKYWNAAQKVMKTIFDHRPQNGLVPVYVDPNRGNFNGGEVRLGSRGDSYYEYLAKQWLLTNQTEKKYSEEYRRAVKGIRTNLLGVSHPNKLLFVGETDLSRSFLSSKMDHLVCFIAGTLAWGATKGHSVDSVGREKLTVEERRDLDLAEELARSCYEMYAQTATGLAPEIVFWRTDIPAGEAETIPFPQELFNYHSAASAASVPQFVGKAVAENGKTDESTRFGGRLSKKLNEIDFSIHHSDGHNLMRPETVESLFILYRITGKQQYRDWGWKIFEAFEKYSKVANGYTSLNDVRIDPPPKRDKMETFFLGETLKYMYLLLSDKPLVPLDRYIFNTEAHPFPIFDVTKDSKLNAQLLYL